MFDNFHLLAGELVSPFGQAPELDLGAFDFFHDLVLETPPESPLASGRTSPSSDDTHDSVLDFATLTFPSDAFLASSFDQEELLATLSDDSLSVLDESTSSSDEEFKTVLKLKPTTQKKRGRRALDRSTAPTPAASPRRPALDDHQVKKSAHNVSERQRRKDLKSSFDALRECIPAIAHDQRVHTGHILREAIELIQQLRAEEARLLAAKHALRR